jgi:cell division protein FtsA
MGIFSKVFGNTKKLDYVLALDIGTEVVKALIFRIDKENKKGIIIGVGRERQKIGNMQSGAISDISGVIISAQKAIEIAKEKSGIKKVKNAVVGIAGELVKGVTTTVHYERIKPEVKIDLPELKNIIEKVQQKAYERIRKQLAWETNQEGIDVKLINAAISSVSIDGYQITNPIGFQGRDVSVSVFNAYAPMIHLGAVETIADELNIDLLSIVAEPYAVARSVGYEGEFDFGAIFIDIGGGTTDIAVVRNGGLEGTKMFALGGRSFTKRLAREVGINFDEAEDLKIKYSEGKLDKISTARVEKILQDDCDVWLSGVELSLEEFAEADLLPSKILLCGGGSALPGVKKALASSKWTKKLSFSKTPEISFLQPSDVADIIDSTQELDSPQDVTPMGLATLVLDLVNEERVMAGILKRAMNNIEK